MVSGNRRLEVIRRLGWKEVEVNVVSFVEEDEPKLIVHHNKQRVKSCKELLNEVSVLLPGLEIAKGKRTDLTSVPANTGVKTRDKVADIVGVSSGQIGKLLFIQKTDSHYIEFIDEGARLLVSNESAKMRKDMH